jgi:hypothetical protein
MPRHLHSAVSLAIAVLLAVAVVASCSASGVTASPATTTIAAPSPSGTPTASATPTATPTAVATATVSATATATPAMPHVDAALEDTLPSKIGGVSLQKWSWPLSSYIASTTGGDKVLYVPWLVKLGKTPDEIDMAISTEATHLVVEAMKVPGVAPATLTSGFGDVAKKAGWPVESGKIGGKSVLKIVDPAAEAAGTLSTAYVYAKGDVMYLVITDDALLLAEALLKLP